MFLPVLVGLGLIVFGISQKEKKRAESVELVKSASIPKISRSYIDLAEYQAEVDKFTQRSLYLLAATSAGALVNPLFTTLAVPFLVIHCIPVFRQGYREVENGKLGGGVMRTLSATGMLWAGQYWILSLGSLLYGYTDKLQLRVRRQSQNRLNKVFSELPNKVWVLRGETDLEIDFQDIVVGDQVVVGAGEPIAVDGIIESGEASIDQQNLTGEAQPIEKGVGDRVLAASIVLSGRIVIRVEQAGAKTVLAGIEDILNQTIDYTSNIELKGKVIADQIVVPTLGISTLAWRFLGFDAATCMLAIYPGEGMSTLGPLSLLNYINYAAKHQILIKDGRVLESLQDVDTVVFDKTGTLTHKVPSVVAVYVFSDNSASKSDILSLASAAEARQEHPIALAIKREAASRNLSIPDLQQASYRLGLGVQAEINGNQILVGSKRFIEGQGIRLPIDCQSAEVTSNLLGHSIIYVADSSQVLGAIELSPQVRDEVIPLVRDLQNRGKAVYVLSGDHNEPTERLAKEIGADHFVAATLPNEKAEYIKAWRAEGKRLCFVGDGINDSIALRTADVSVSLTGASSVASDTANVVLLDGNLKRLPFLFDLADDLKVNMRNNLLALTISSPLIFVAVLLAQKYRYFITTMLVSASALAGIANATVVATDRLKALEPQSASLRDPEKKDQSG
jgi:heavy metal translocating P-type ATPase